LCDKLLPEAGLKADLPRGVNGVTQRGELFCTNAVLCLKPGGDQVPLKSTWKNNCGKHFLRRQIEIVRPGLVICFGEVSYRAITNLYGLRREERFPDAVELPEPYELFGGIKMMAVYHCSPPVLNTHRPLEKQLADWRRVGVVVSRLREDRRTEMGRT